MIDSIHGKERRCLCHLPAALIAEILSHLSILDFFSFRAVCKCWRLAFLQCSNSIPQNRAQRQLPWFLFLNAKFSNSVMNKRMKPLLYTTGKLGDLSTQIVYTTDVPELCGSQILLSKYGWLLLFTMEMAGPSLFFFNPFSKAKIALPTINVSKLCEPVFDISTSPIRPDCMVFLIFYDRCVRFKIKLCKPGKSVWRTYEFDFWAHSLNESLIVNTVFFKGTWYCLHKSVDISAFDTVDCTWKFSKQTQIKVHPANLLSYAIRRENQVFLRICGEKIYTVKLGDPLSIEEDGIDFQMGDPLQLKFEHRLSNRVKEEIQSLPFDSFNSNEWCIEFSLASRNGMNFQLHRFGKYVDRLSGGRLHNPGFCTNSDCSAIIMWVQPTWFNSSPDSSQST